MSQPDYNARVFGTADATSTGFVPIGSTSGVLLHTVSVLSTSGTGTFILYKTSSSSTGNELITLTGALGVQRTYTFDIQTPLLGRGQTTSTAEVVVTWA